MGYRCSVQEATGFSPYALMFGIPPTIPPAIRERMSPSVGFDQVESSRELETKSVAAQAHVRYSSS